MANIICFFVIINREDGKGFAKLSLSWRTWPEWSGRRLLKPGGVDHRYSTASIGGLDIRISVLHEVLSVIPNYLGIFLL
jgi:hypothetical protein